MILFSVLFVCFKSPSILFRNKLCKSSDDISSIVDPLINASTHLHLDASHTSFVPPVHSAWQVLARNSFKGVWRPLEVIGGSECGQSLANLFKRLKGKKQTAREKVWNDLWKKQNQKESHTKKSLVMFIVSHRRTKVVPFQWSNFCVFIFKFNAYFIYS